MSTKSQRVWESRIHNAISLAQMGDGDYDKAMSLILRTIRYALADAREWERQNNDARYGNSPQAKHRTELLKKRRERLNSEWAEYGLTIVNYGLYPTVTTHKGGSDVISLCYFD